MNALRHLTPEHQVAALFLIVFGLLTLVSATMFLLGLRERRHPMHDERWREELAHLVKLQQTTWVMVVAFWIGWTLGDTAATVLFALISFFALREYITLSPTRRGDHRSLLLAFFVILPGQYWLVASAHFDLFTVFIPVYTFLAIPVVSALANEPNDFLERTAKMQWGIMVCVYGMSHVPALLLLEFPGFKGKSAFLVFFLVGVVQSCMLAQHLVGRLMERPAFAPNVSRGFNWLGWGIGVALGVFLGALFSFITPFKYGQAMAMALIACVAGSMGHLVMKALKRDRGIPNWGRRGTGVTGANGLLDRVDSLCFAAPIFFHSVRWYFGI